MTLENKLKEGDKIFVLRDSDRGEMNNHYIAVTGILVDTHPKLKLDPYIVASTDGHVLFGTYFTNINLPKTYDINPSEQAIIISSTFADHIKHISKEKSYNHSKSKPKMIKYLQSSKLI